MFLDAERTLSYGNKWLLRVPPGRAGFGSSSAWNCLCDTVSTSLLVSGISVVQTEEVAGAGKGKLSLMSAHKAMNGPILKIEKKNNEKKFLQLINDRLKI